jgi:hypothetical protein
MKPLSIIDIPAPESSARHMTKLILSGLAGVLVIALMAFLIYQLV